MELFMLKAYRTTEEFHKKLDAIIEGYVADIQGIMEKSSAAENKVMENGRLGEEEKRAKLERNRKGTYDKLLKAYGECEMRLYGAAVDTEKEFTELFEKRKSMVSGFDKHFVFLYYNEACRDMQKIYEEKMKEAGTMYRKKVFGLNDFMGDGNYE